MSNKQYHTRNQLLQLYPAVGDKTMRKILMYVTPEGKVGTWPGFSIEQFEEAYEDYKQKQSKELDNDIGDGNIDSTLSREYSKADLRLKQLRADQIALDLADRKKKLVNRKQVESFIQFHISVVANKMKDIFKDNGEEYYNDIITSIKSELKTYLEENPIGEDIDEECFEAPEPIYDEFGEEIIDET